MLVPVNLKLRWFAIYAGFGLLLSVVITAILTQAATRQIQQQVGVSLANVAEQVAHQLERGMVERLRDLQTAAQLMPTPDSEASNVRLERLVAALYNSYSDYAWIGITDRSGKVLISSENILEGADVSARPWFQGALQQPYFIGDVHGALLLEKILNPNGDEPLRFVDISLPLKDAEGTIWGVFGSHLNWQWAEGVEQNALRSLESLPGTDILLVSSENQIILGPDTLKGQALQTPVADEVREKGWGLQEWRDGAEYLIGYAQVRSSANYQGPQWQVMVREPIALALQPITELRWQAAWIGLAVALTFAGIGWISAGHIARPFANLSSKLEREVRERTDELRASNEKLRQLATTDSLTGLLNRRALFERAEQLQQQALRHGQPLAVVMLDLDHFKQVNDRYGHAAGDDVLVELANDLRAQLREVDLGARTGGEEFTLVLDGSTAEQAKKVVERLATTFKAHRFTSGDDEFQVTLSAGVVLWEPEQSFDKAVDHADKRLYQAKEKGRDCVVAASD
ncbi:sensor domain-containing diguanylate cyclase [Pseudidiomarina homiensis]|uniref:sensor domain-containing diguanylate cyclase n=1 Tax=Pseudidiomarina homiensis TaxID=364198 RepID=UPI00215A602D|nr:sensor domain-containing diguanylate cyclase [Pseudidiomarina homiensis]